MYVADLVQLTRVRSNCSRKIPDTVTDDYIWLRFLDSEENPLSFLSPREREVLQLVVDGKTSGEIAKRLSLSPKKLTLIEVESCKSSKFMIFLPW